jgi:hypothetical protein
MLNLPVNGLRGYIANSQELRQKHVWVGRFLNLSNAVVARVSGIVKKNPECRNIREIWLRPDL